jgi:hypothetical protein
LVCCHPDFVFFENHPFPVDVVICHWAPVVGTLIVVFVYLAAKISLIDVLKFMKMDDFRLMI